MTLTDLPKFEHSDATAVLGLRPVDFLVTNILAAAGITVECQLAVHRRTYFHADAIGIPSQ